MKVFILVISFLFIAFVLHGGLRLVSYEPSRLETHRVFLRTQYFGEGLGKIYKNRFGIFYFDKVYPIGTKFQTVFFSSLDPVLVFLPLYGFLFYWDYRKNKIVKK
jgi:hypothetical protein